MSTPAPSWKATDGRSVPETAGRPLLENERTRQRRAFLAVAAAAGFLLIGLAGLLWWLWAQESGPTLHALTWADYGTEETDAPSLPPAADQTFLPLPSGTAAAPAAAPAPAAPVAGPAAGSAAAGSPDAPEGTDSPVVVQPTDVLRLAAAGFSASASGALWNEAALVGLAGGPAARTREQLDELAAGEGTAVIYVALLPERTADGEPGFRLPGGESVGATDLLLRLAQAAAGRRAVVLLEAGPPPSPAAPGRGGSGYAADLGRAVADLRAAGRLPDSFAVLLAASGPGEGSGAEEGGGSLFAEAVARFLPTSLTVGELTAAVAERVSARSRAQRGVPQTVQLVGEPNLKLRNARGTPTAADLGTAMNQDRSLAAETTLRALWTRHERLRATAPHRRDPESWKSGREWLLAAERRRRAGQVESAERAATRAAAAFDRLEAPSPSTPAAAPAPAPAPAGAAGETAPSLASARRARLTPAAGTTPTPARGAAVERVVDLTVRWEQAAARPDAAAAVAPLLNWAGEELATAEAWLRVDEPAAFAALPGAAPHLDGAERALDTLETGAAADAAERAEALRAEIAADGPFLTRWRTQVRTAERAVDGQSPVPADPAGPDADLADALAGATAIDAALIELAEAAADAVRSAGSRNDGAAAWARHEAALNRLRTATGETQASWGRALAGFQRATVATLARIGPPEAADALLSVPTPLSAAGPLPRLDLREIAGTPRGPGEVPPPSAPPRWQPGSWLAFWSGRVAPAVLPTGPPAVYAAFPLAPPADVPTTPAVDAFATLATAGTSAPAAAVVAAAGIAGRGTGDAGTELVTPAGPLPAGDPAPLGPIAVAELSAAGQPLAVRAGRVAPAFDASGWSVQFLPAGRPDGPATLRLPAPRTAADPVRVRPVLQHPADAADRVASATVAVRRWMIDDARASGRWVDWLPPQEFALSRPASGDGAPVAEDAPVAAARRGDLLLTPLPTADAAAPAEIAGGLLFEFRIVPPAGGERIVSLLTVPRLEDPTDRLDATQEWTDLGGAVRRLTVAVNPAAGASAEGIEDAGGPTPIALTLDPRLAACRGGSQWNLTGTFAPGGDGPAAGGAAVRLQADFDVAELRAASLQALGRGPRGDGLTGPPLWVELTVAGGLTAARWELSGDGAGLVRVPTTSGYRPRPVLAPLPTAEDAASPIVTGGAAEPTVIAASNSPESAAPAGLWAGDDVLIRRTPGPATLAFRFPPPPGIAKRARWRRDADGAWTPEAPVALRLGLDRPGAAFTPPVRRIVAAPVWRRAEATVAGGVWSVATGFEPWEVVLPLPASGRFTLRYEAGEAAGEMALAVDAGPPTTRLSVPDAVAAGESFQVRLEAADAAAGLRDVRLTATPEGAAAATVNAADGAGGAPEASGTATLTMGAAPLTVRLTATDAVGRTAETQAVVALLPPPPGSEPKGSMVVTFPAVGSGTRETIVTLTGPDDAEKRVNARTGEALFEELPPGEYEVKIREVLRFNDRLQRSGAAKATVKEEEKAAADVKYEEPAADGQAG
ncbi:hypothetical protein [Alienimonas californiensis]|uniref:Uncharacterized protein n=1 Tax=Alienimonas californiensis TaxID=2527989 RepID=A0A517P4D3_9PLAN|nr:hypothetical protein [Alienimonas californiensis]QDT14248.1 hypothetical protein CA12_03190 [Alienimonas californiensis]